MQQPFQSGQQGANGPTGFESGRAYPNSDGKAARKKEDYIDFEEIKEG